MEKNLAVPYKSQHDSDSFKSNADCGPATLAMMLGFYGTQISVGEVLAKMGNPTGYTSIPQLAKVAHDLGFALISKVDANFQDIKNYLDKDIPVGVVGGYGFLSSRQDTNFKGSHIMCVVGYRADDSIYANDPDYWGGFEKDGDHHVYTFADFNNFWRNDGNKEGNQPDILFIITPLNQATPAVNKTFPKRVAVTATLPLRARTEPILEDRFIAKKFSKGNELTVVGSVQGADVEGNNTWYLVVDEPRNLYVWSGAVEEIKDQPVKATTPSTPPAVSNPQVSIAPAASGDALEQMQMMYQLSKEYLIEHNALNEEEVVVPEKKGLMQSLKEALHIQ
jgi:hypothetical protein